MIVSPDQGSLCDNVSPDQGSLSDNVSPDQGSLSDNVSPDQGSLSDNVKEQVAQQLIGVQKLTEGDIDAAIAYEVLCKVSD